MKKEQIEARMVIYDDIIVHLDMDLTDIPEELKQQKIVQKQLKNMAHKWYCKMMKEKTNEVIM